MKERPILFSGAMVRAILEGQKTQTRRIVKPQPRHDDHYLQPMCGTSPPPDPVEFGEKGLWREVGPDYPDDASDDRRCPYGIPGDRLWVKETFATTDDETIYRATEGRSLCDLKWKPSIYMPRALSRITLEVTDVRAERLQDMTPNDAMAEGAVEAYSHQTSPPPRGQGRTLEEHRAFTQRAIQPGRPALVGYFAALWDEINGKRAGWSSNPWVWVVSFRTALSTPDPKSATTEE